MYIKRSFWGRDQSGIRFTMLRDYTKHACKYNIKLCCIQSHKRRAGIGNKIGLCAYATSIYQTRLTCWYIFNRCHKIGFLWATQIVKWMRVRSLSNKLAVRLFLCEEHAFNGQVCTRNKNIDHIRSDARFYLFYFTNILPNFMASKPNYYSNVWVAHAFMMMMMTWWHQSAFWLLVLIDCVQIASKWRWRARWRCRIYASEPLGKVCGCALCGRRFVRV